jgi:hypothetical protein
MRRREGRSPYVWLFGNATCGEVNHVDVTNNARQRGRDETGRIDLVLAERVKNGGPRA